MVKRWSWEVHKHKCVCLVVFGVIWRVFGHILSDVRTEDEEDDLQGPNSCFPLRTLSKTIHQIKQLLSTLWNTHTHRERERSDSHLLSKAMLIWYSEVFSGRTSHVRLRSLVQPGEFISIIFHPVPERLQIQSKTNSADVSCTERRHHWVTVETISYKTLTDYQMLN